MQASAEGPAGTAWARALQAAERGRGRFRTAAGLLVLAILYSRIAETPRAGRLVHGAAEAVVLGLAAVVFVVRSRQGGSRGLMALASFWALTVLYLAVLYASSVWAVDGGAAVAQADTLAIDVVVVYLIVEIFDSPARQRFATWTVIVIAGGLGALAIFQRLTGTYHTSYFGLAQASVQQIVGQSHGFRSAGPVGDPNFFGMALVVVVPLALFRWRDEHDRRLRAVAALAALMLLGGIALTYSRGALVALVAVLIGFTLLAGISPQRVAACVVVLLPFSILVPHQLTQRAASIFQGDHSITGRTESDLVAFDIFIRHPVAGVGANNYHLAYLPYAFERHALDAVPYAHNLYLAVAAETGLVGLATLFGAVAVVLLRALQARAGALREARPVVADLAAGYFLAVTASLVGSAFLPLAYPRYLWILVGLTLAVTLPDRPAGTSPTAVSAVASAARPVRGRPAGPPSPRP